MKYILHMSIDQTDKIDLIGDSKDSEKVIIGISDHLNWEEETFHLNLLQAKINAYLGYLENQLYIDRPSARGKIIEINIIAKYPIPIKIVQNQYRCIEETLNNAGYLFSVEMLN